MKELFLLISCIVLFTCVSDAQDSVSISDFRYPETRAIDWKAGLSGNFGRNYSESFPLYFSREYFTNQWAGALYLNTTYQQFYTKDNHDQRISFDARGEYNGRSVESEQLLFAERVPTSIRELEWSYHGEFQWTYYHYLNEEGFHFIGSVNPRYSQYSNEISTRYNFSNRDSSYDDYSRGNNIYFSGKIGFGFGRMRDGTVVYQALRLIERLKEDGLIIRPMTKDEVLGLVNRIFKRREYQINYERFEKYFFQDIVQELVESGLVQKESLIPFSVVRMMETFRIESIQPRLFGWRLYYLFEDSHIQSLSEYRRLLEDIHSLNNDWVYQHLLGFEYGLPISLTTHFNATTTVEIPIWDYKRKYKFDVNTSLIYELGERIELIGSYFFNRRADNLTLGANESFTRTIQHKIQGNFVYFLEDQIRFDLNLAHSWMDYSHFQDEGSSGWVEGNSGLSLSFGLNYNIY